MASQVRNPKEISAGRTNLVAEPGKQEVVVTRLFDVPRERLFKAMTDPSLVPQWWGPEYLNTVVDRMDVEPGGTWHFIQQDPDGNKYAFHGVYHQVASPERLVYTFEYEGVPGHVALETCTFEDLGGRTLLTDQLVFQSVEDRDGMLHSGMEDGQDATWSRLDALLAKL